MKTVKHKTALCIPSAVAWGGGQGAMAPIPKSDLGGAKVSFAPPPKKTPSLDYLYKKKHEHI